MRVGDEKKTLLDKKVADSSDEEDTDYVTKTYYKKMEIMMNKSGKPESNNNTQHR